MKNVCCRCRKYFPNNHNLASCPICGDPLTEIDDNKKYSAYFLNSRTAEIVSIAESREKRSVSGRQPLSDSGGSAGSSLGTPPSRSSSAPTMFSDHSHEPPRSSVTVKQPKSSVYPAGRTAAESAHSRRAYAGIINNYERSEVGGQNFFESASLFFRGLHHGNTRHVITFVDEGDNQTYRVCFYGEFSAVGSAIPQIGEHIYIGGRPSGNTFYSENVYIGENGGRRIVVKNQQPRMERRNALPIIIIAIVLLVLFFAVDLVMNGGIGLVGEAFQTFVISVEVCLVLGMIFLSRRIRFRTIAVIAVIVGVVLTAFSYNVGGISAWLGSALTEIITVALMLGLMIYAIILIVTAGRR